MVLVDFQISTWIFLINKEAMHHHEFVRTKMLVDGQHDITYCKIEWSWICRDIVYNNIMYTNILCTVTDASKRACIALSSLWYIISIRIYIGCIWVWYIILMISTILQSFFEGTVAFFVTRLSDSSATFKGSVSPPLCDVCSRIVYGRHTIILYTNWFIQ